MKTPDAIPKPPSKEALATARHIVIDPFPLTQTQVRALLGSLAPRVLLAVHVLPDGTNPHMIHTLIFTPVKRCDQLATIHLQVESVTALDKSWPLLTVYDLLYRGVADMIYTDPKEKVWTLYWFDIQEDQVALRTSSRFRGNPAEAYEEVLEASPTAYADFALVKRTWTSWALNTDCQEISVSEVAAVVLSAITKRRLEIVLNAINDSPVKGPDSPKTYEEFMAKVQL